MDDVCRYEFCLRRMGSIELGYQPWLSRVLRIAEMIREDAMDLYNYHNVLYQIQYIDLSGTHTLVVKTIRNSQE